MTLLRCVACRGVSRHIMRGFSGGGGVQAEACRRRRPRRCGPGGGSALAAAPHTSPRFLRDSALKPRPSPLLRSHVVRTGAPCAGAAPGRRRAAGVAAAERRRQGRIGADRPDGKRLRRQVRFTRSLSRRARWHAPRCRLARRARRFWRERLRQQLAPRRCAFAMQAFAACVRRRSESDAPVTRDGPSRTCSLRFAALSPLLADLMMRRIATARSSNSASRPASSWRGSSSRPSALISG